MFSINGFTYDAYRELAGRLADRRDVLTFDQFHQPGFQPPERFLLLRHDVDVDPQPALELATVEADANLRSTYFLMVTSGLYNLLSPRWQAIPRRLIELGHEVGLHYDAAAIELLGVPPMDILSRECDLLSRLAGREVRSIAMHNPSVHGPDPFADQHHYVSAYEPRFTTEIAYYSDSCGAWRNAAHAALIGRADELPGRIHLLTHPLFWADTPADRWARLEALRQRRLADLDAELAVPEDIWRGHPAPAEHDARLRKAGE